MCKVIFLTEMSMENPGKWNSVTEYVRSGGNKSAFYSKLKVTPEKDLPSASTIATVTTNIHQQNISRTDKWLMVNGIGGGRARDLASKINEHNLKLVPWVGVAALLESSDTPLESGRAYCFLPLPVKTGLPVQINGYFELSSNRRDIWHGTDMTGVGQLRSEWNSVLLEDVIGPAYARLILEATRIIGFNDQFLSLWPTSLVDKPWMSVVTSMYRSLARLPVFWSDIRGGSWLKLDEVIMIPHAVNNVDNLTSILLHEGVKITRLPNKHVEMILKLEENVKFLSPEYLKSVLIAPGPHPYLQNIEHVTSLLDYMLSNLENNVTLFPFITYSRSRNLNCYKEYHLFLYGVVK